MNTQLTLNDAISNVDGKLVTSSLKVADVFSKQHKDVIRKLETLDCSPDFGERNFRTLDPVATFDVRLKSHEEISKDKSSGYLMLDI